MLTEKLKIRLIDAKTKFYGWLHHLTRHDAFTMALVATFMVSSLFGGFVWVKATNDKAGSWIPSPDLSLNLIEDAPEETKTEAERNLAKNEDNDAPDDNPDAEQNNSQGKSPDPDPGSDPEPEAGPEPEPEPGTWYGYVKPGPTNTGPTNDSILVDYTNAQIESMMEDGAVFENVRITGGDIDVLADNMTFRNFVINANGNNYGIVQRSGHGNLTLEDGEIYNMNSAAILGLGYTARRLNIHDSNGDGLKPQNTAGSVGAVLVESSWIHSLGKGSGAHADGSQSRSAAYPVTFRGNNCDMPINSKGGPGDPYKSNACFILHEAEGNLVNYTVEYNWLNGGNYTVYCGGDGSFNYFRYNRFGRGYNYGIVTGTCDEWTGNIWDDTEEAV